MYGIGIQGTQTYPHSCVSVCSANWMFMPLTHKSTADDAFRTCKTIAFRSLTLPPIILHSLCVCNNFFNACILIFLPANGTKKKCGRKNEMVHNCVCVLRLWVKRNEMKTTVKMFVAAAAAASALIENAVLHHHHRYYYLQHIFVSSNLLGVSILGIWLWCGNTETTELSLRSIRYTHDSNGRLCAVGFFPRFFAFPFPFNKRQLIFNVRQRRRPLLNCNKITFWLERFNHYIMRIFN